MCYINDTYYMYLVIPSKTDMQYYLLEEHKQEE